MRQSEDLEWVFPKFPPSSDEAAVRFELPCGVSLSFTLRDEEDVTGDHLKRWRIRLPALAKQAGLNSFSYNQWERAAECVYENDDRDWPGMVLAPGSHLEHMWVEGGHVLLIVDASSAILTGDRVPHGLQRMREKLPTAVATCPLRINVKWTAWEPFPLDS